MESPEKNTGEKKDKKNKIIIILCIVLAVVIVVLTVFTTLYFSGKKHDDNYADSMYFDTEGESYYFEDLSDYIGFWQTENSQDKELVIYYMDSTSLSFSLRYQRIFCSEIMQASLDRNVAYFQSFDVAGTMTLSGGYITLNITMSNIEGILPNSTEIFTVHISDMSQYSELAMPLDPYVIEVKNERLSIYKEPTYASEIVGEITDKGKYTIVEESIDPWVNSVWGRLESGQGWINLSDAEMERGSVADESVPSESPSEEWTMPSYSYSSGGRYDNNTNYSHNGSTKDNTPSKTPDAPSTNDEFDFKIAMVIVKGIEFNYMSKYYSAPSDMDSYMNDSVEAEIEYCEPSKYRTGNERITNLYRANGTFSEDEIGDAYYSAGTDDFKIFKIRVKGKRYETFKGVESYDPPRIDYRKYNAYGAIIANGSIIEYEAFAGRERVPDLDETVYIGLYSSEVSRVDLVVFGFNPQDFKE